MRRFDDMTERFAQALKESADELIEVGFPQAESIRQQILASGGYMQN